MKTRHTLTRLALVLSLALFLTSGSNGSAEEPGPRSFLKVGSDYQITFPGSGISNVKILEHVGGQWFRVEYLRINHVFDGRPAVAVNPASGEKPIERWINFANVLSVGEAKEPEKKEPETK